MIDADTVITALRAAVAEKGPEHIQPECVYFSYTGNGKRIPTCIWGNAWHRITGSVQPPTGHPLYFRGSTDLHFSRKVAEAFDLDEHAASVVTVAQAIADGVDRTERGSWGEALAAAERQYGQVLPAL